MYSTCRVPVENSRSPYRGYPQKIVNIHPALLPAFGGKGMYGMHVHEAVIKSGVKEKWYQHTLC